MWLGRTRSVIAFCVMVSVCGPGAKADSRASNSITGEQRDSTPADNREFPWEVKLRSLAALRCSGVLLDSRWVLTAASCFEGNYLQPSSYNVDLYYNGGEVILTSPSPPSPRPTAPASPFTPTPRSDQSIYVESFYLHGRYSEGDRRHNVALVHLHDDVIWKSTFVDVIGPQDDVDGDDCVTVGWGANGTGEPVTPSVRKWHVTNSTVCSRHYNVTVYPDELCAHLLRTGNGVCTGDIGAPLLCRQNATWILKGIVTHTWRCHDHDQDPQPARFLSIQHYLPFLLKRGHFKDRHSEK